MKDFFYLYFIVSTPLGGKAFLNYKRALKYFDSLEGSRQLYGNHLFKGFHGLKYVFYTGDSQSSLISHEQIKAVESFSVDAEL